MIILGAQLSAADYEAFKAAMAQQLPKLNIQTINAAGRFCINGCMTDTDIAAIHAIYDDQRQAPQFNMMAHQRRERRRRQTHNARQKRRADALRFWR